MEKIVDRNIDLGEFIPQPDDDVIVCRCEEVTKGEIRRAVHDGMRDLSEIRRYLRTGMGLCQGMPNRIPVVEKDFIFAAISEEMGAIFAICVLLICLGCFIQFMMIATQMQAMFYKIIAVGLGMEYVVQVFLTVGGVTKFIPSTGVTLPFVSYGGSSIVTTFLLFSIIQGLYIIKRNDEEEMEEMEAQEE